MHCIDTDQASDLDLGSNALAGHHFLQGMLVSRRSCSQQNLLLVQYQRPVCQQQVDLLCIVQSESLIALPACSDLRWSEPERDLTQIGEVRGMCLQHC